MARTADEEAIISRFSQTYLRGQCEVLRGVERAVCGCDYGATGWTTQQEADEAVKLLDLRPGRRLLEVGTGAGWPGLYLAKRAGCDVALTDLPFEGLRIARERALADGLNGRCWIANADGSALPFRDACFDAIYHSDVLCCLVDKEGVLRACRRVARPNGTMVFSIILIAPGLSFPDHGRAIAAGPPFVESPSSYGALLEKTGWEMTHSSDLTGEFLAAVRQHVRFLEERAFEVAQEIGQEDAEAVLARSRQRADGIERGLLRRELISAIPAPIGR